MSDAENSEEELDPRIQVELERLNKSCAEINNLENELEEAKSQFIISKNKQLERLNYWHKKYPIPIAKAKPYYEALKLAEVFQIETQKAVHEFQKTNSLYKTAKETLSVAESSLTDQSEIPDAWQEHLSLTITKIGLSKEAANRAGNHHQAVAEQYQQADRRCQQLEKDLKKFIQKSKLYYDEKSRWNVQIETQKSHIHEIEQSLIFTKKVYKEAMHNLSKISEEIHNKRNLAKQTKSSNPNECQSSSSTDPRKFQSNNNNSDNHSLSNESQTSETETKKIKNFLDLYNLTLPVKDDHSRALSSAYHSDSTTKTYDELKDCEVSEYTSLGLNSTASNSRGSSPSNSLENDDWNKLNDLNNINSRDLPSSDYSSLEHTTNTNKTMNSEVDSNKMPEFSSSSLSRINTSDMNQFNHMTKANSGFANDDTNLGISSLTLNSLEHKSSSNAQNRNSGFQSNVRQTSSSRSTKHKSNVKTSLKSTKTVINETPLLSNLLLQNSARS